MKITAEPRSDQLNADDFVGRTAVYTITEVTPGTAEQKYDIHLAEVDRAWRPPLTVLRIMLAAWGDEAANWVGQRVELYREPSVKFGGSAVGGIRIARMSGLPDGKPMRVSLSEARGKRAAYTVDPLPDAAPAQSKPAPAQHFPSREEVAACEDLHQLQTWSAASTGARKAAIEARIAELMEPPDDPA